MVGRDESETCKQWVGMEIKDNTTLSQYIKTKLGAHDVKFIRTPNSGPPEHEYGLQIIWLVYDFNNCENYEEAVDLFHDGLKLSIGDYYSDKLKKTIELREQEIKHLNEQISDLNRYKIAYELNKGT